MQLPNTAVALSPAHAWFMSNLPEIQSRSNACFARLTPDRRQEAQAEVAAVVFKAVDSAARRGVIARITPFHLVNNAARQFREGRRITGSSSTDVMAEATQRKGRRRRHVPLWRSARPVASRTPDAPAWPRGWRIGVWIRDRMNKFV